MIFTPVRTWPIICCHEPEDDEDLTTQRRNRDGTARELPSTPTVKAYASYMGGVDRRDQNTRLNKEKKP